MTYTPEELERIREADLELLKALQWALQNLKELAETYPNDAHWSYGAIDPRDIARAAIAKAKGE